MEHARKLALVDLRMLPQIQPQQQPSLPPPPPQQQQQQDRHVEYKELQKPADKQAKTSLSLAMRCILEDETMTDDMKCRLYQQALNRYLNMGAEIPDVDDQQPTRPTINPIRQPVIQTLTPSTTPRRSGRKSKRTKVRQWLQY
jgi:hypothetical protein